jgi:hypothetical protein
MIIDIGLQYIFIFKSIICFNILIKNLLKKGGEIFLKQSRKQMIMNHIY